MTGERNDIPAAVPVLLLAAAIAAAPVLTATGATAHLLLLAALLCMAVRVRAALLLLALWAGWTIGERHAATRKAEAAVLRPLLTDRFVTIRAELTREWRKHDRFSSITFDAFNVEGHPVEQPLSAFLSDEGPPVPLRCRTIRAEGFLRRGDDGRLSLSIKSAQLVACEGRLEWWEPRLWNRRLARALDEAAGSDPKLQTAAAVSKALILGRSDSLPADVRADYRDGGTYHLLVFSGMQIALTAAFLSFAFRATGRPRGGDWALLLLSCAAPFFAGLEPSVTRASSMIGLYALTRIIGRPTSYANLLFVSAGLRLAAAPEELGDAGFALTYSATAGILLALRCAPKRRVARMFATAAGAEIATSAFTILFFHRYTAGGSLLTILLSPLMTAMFVLSGAAAATALFDPPAAGLVLEWIAHLDTLCRRANRLFADDLHVATLVPCPPLTLVCASIAAVILLSVSRTSRVRITAFAAFLLPLGVSLWLAHARSVVNAPSATFIDVGQGDATLLRNGATAVLVDGGGHEGGSTFGARVLLPQLIDRGVRTLDAVVLSHPHPDHMGGLSAVLENFEVKELWLSGRAIGSGARDLVALAHERGVRVRLLRNGERMAAGSLRFRAFVPGRFRRATINNASVVLWATTGTGRSLLLTGDVERDAERWLVDEWKSEIAATVLKVPHHGSRTSTSEALLAAVDPRISVISCGRRNRFGHPHDVVTQRLADASVRTWRTDRHGTIEMTLEDRALVVAPGIDTPPAQP